MNRQGKVIPKQIKKLSVEKQRSEKTEQLKRKHRIFSNAYYCFIPFIFIVMFFFGGQARNTCNATVNLQEIRVGSELDFPPYALLDERGQATGFSVDLIKAVTDAMGLSVKISTGTWDAVWNSIVTGRIDVLPIVAKLPERQHLVDFSLAHTETYDAFFVRKGDSPIPNIAAAQGKAIVVMRSDAAHHEMLARNFQGKLIFVDTIPTGLSLISSGKYDAFLCSKLIGTILLKKNGLKDLSAGPPIPDYKRVFSFAVKKGETELLEKLNQGLLIVKTNGEYDRIYAKWLTIDDPWRKVRKYLFPALIVLIALILISGLWLVMLQRLVKKRTCELEATNELLHQAHEELERRVQERTAELVQANQLLHSQIDERKRAEEALRYSERSYKALFERISSAVAVYEAVDDGEDFIFRDFNSAGEAIEHMSREYLIGKRVTEVFQGVQEFGFLEIFQRVWKTGRPEYFPARLYKDERDVGSWRESWVYKLPSNELVAVYNDVTERKHAEEALKLHAEIERNMSEAAYLIRVDNGVIVYTNPSFDSLLGYNHGDLIGQHVSIVNAPSDKKPEVVANEIISTLAQTGMWSGEVLNIRKDGTIFWSHANVITVEHPRHGKVWLSMHRDITERKLMEQKLRESEERFRTIFENSSSAMAIIERDTTISMINKEYCKMGLYDEKDIIGKSWTTQIPPSDLERLKEYNRKRLIDPKSAPDHYEFSFCRKDGTIRHSLMSVAMIPTSQNIICSFIDITDRKQAEEERQDTQERLTMAQEIAHVGSWEYNLETGDIWGSKEALRIYGLQSEAGRFPIDQIEACIPEREMVHQALVDLIEHEKDYDLVFAINPADGSKQKFISSIARLILDEKRKPLKVVGVIQDITERKQAEDTLRETRDYLESLIHFANAPIIVWDAKTVVIRFNQAFERLTGYIAGEVIGKELHILFPDTSRNASMKEISRTSCGEYWESVEIPILCKNGDVKLVLWNSANIHANNGETLIATIAQGMDITERKQGEEDLRILNDRHELAVGSAGIGVWDWDIKQNRLEWDEQMYILYGTRKDDFAGAYEAWLKSVHPDDMTRCNDVSERARSGEIPYDTEFRIIGTNGEIRHLKAYGRVQRDEHGQPIRMTGINYDITNLKLAEEKITASLREKETLLKEIHHRVKNNLQIISSLLKLQARYIEDEKLDGIFRDCQNRITAMAYVHSLLYKSQNFAEINFGEYIQETATQLLRSYQTSTEAISLVIRAEDIMLSIDTAVPCGLIINELVTNALKYAFPELKKGKITIEMKRTDNDGIRLLFEDNGIGFPKSVDFFKTETFGLKLVHMLVEQLNGTIEQYVNNGTRYVIVLEPETFQEM